MTFFDSRSAKGISRGISDFNFTFAQNHTPAAPSVQAQITMASPGGNVDLNLTREGGRRMVLA
jgi:hypothetical protein